MEFSLLWAAAVGVGAVYGMLWLEARLRGEARDPRLFEIVLAAGILGLVVGRLAAMITGGVNPITNPGDMLIVRGGVSTGPAALAAVAYVAWAGRKEFPDIADDLAAPAMAGLAGWHGSCLIRGSCLGISSDLPWAFGESGSALARHPVEIYAALLFVAAAFALLLWRWRGRPPGGAPAGLALAAAGGIRLATEPFRAALSGGPVWWYTAAVAGGLVLTVWALSATARSKEANASD